MSDEKNWISEYAPKKISDIEGQEKAVLTAIKELESFKKTRKAVLLYGPPGTGKTSFAYAYAKEKNLEIVELNASDFRSKNDLEKNLFEAMIQGSLFHKGKLILIDEIDGLSGREDRGAIPYLSKIIEKSPFPVVMTANDIFDSKFSSLRRKSVCIEFHRLNYLSIKKILKKICEEENLRYDESAISSLARMAGGDARAAINDLQILASSSKEITSELVKELAPRDLKGEIFDALRIILKTTSFANAFGALDSLDEKNDEIILWLDKNIPYEYKKPDDLLRAYEALANADVFTSRIIKRQYWRLLVYVYLEMSVGVALAKKEKNSNFIRYQPPSRILKMWIYNQKLKKINEISKQISDKYFISPKDITQDLLPFLSIIFNSKTAKGMEMAKKIKEELDLDSQQVSSIIKLAKPNNR